MALEKILVGDDQLDFARKNFPFIPDADIEYVRTPEEVIKKALSGTYTLVITDLNYSPQGEEGFTVLEALKESKVRKILWTGNAYDPGVKERAESLGAEVLDKDELSTLVGQVKSRAPIKEGGKVLVYLSGQPPVQEALRKFFGLFDYEGMVLSSDLGSELMKGEYGLVIDTSTRTHAEGHGQVAHDMKYLELREVPRVIEIYNMDLPKAILVVDEYLKRYLTPPASR